ncbi:MAG: helix-turn-helix domain-containing protein [Aeromonas sp.]
MSEQQQQKRVRTSTSGLPSRQEQAELAKSVGVRLREAREMAGMSQLSAAKHIGYANSTKLSKIESGKHSSQIPIWVLKRAALVYDVAIDYLLGVSETMEQEDGRHAALREMMTHMREDWERLRQRDVLVQASMLNRIKYVETGVMLIKQETAAASEAMERVIELNPQEWQEVKGGARLAADIERAAAAARTASNNIKRFRAECATAGGAAQLDLVFG